MSAKNISALGFAAFAIAAGALFAADGDSGTLNVNVSADFGNTKEVNKNPVGIFYEDLGRAADGGFYAELVENRDFEYSAADKDGWNGMTAWRVLALEGASGVSEIATADPIHANNSHYIVLHVRQPNTVFLQNNGFGGFGHEKVDGASPMAGVGSPEGGIPVKRGAKYDFSVFMRYVGTEGKHYVHVQLTDPDGNCLGQANFYREKTSTWEKVEAVLTSNADCDNATLTVIPQSEGDYHFDMISLFPQDTFRGRKNGLRKDLAEAIEGLHPSFVRFPGGCVIHGDCVANAYRWEESVGPLEARVPIRNMRHYHQTRGLGYYEYFQFCEDIGAEPLPVVPVGQSCQFSGGPAHCELLPMDRMEQLTQSILNLIEWANGPADSEWGRVRAEAGHPEPFNMKYIALGNEERYTEGYAERMTMICKAIQAKYPDIRICGNAGPGANDDFHDVTDGRDFTLGWKLAADNHMALVDEHYYKPASWVYDNLDYYDKYDRGGPKVFLGEYNFNTSLDGGMETALVTSLYHHMMERNGDLVVCATYSLCLVRNRNLGTNQRTLINFNRSTHSKSDSYWILKMFAESAGDRYVSTKLDVGSSDEFDLKRVGASVLRDTASGDIFVKVTNMTGRPAAVSIDLGGQAASENATLTSYSAKSLDDMDAVLKSGPFRGGSKMQLAAGPYSLNIIRLGDGASAK